MNEPNDTAQEGFDQLKRNLEVRYPEDSDLSLDEFLNVESLLALAVRVCGPGADPRKADRLLSNYQLIRPETIGADGHLMQMARRHLFSLASSTAWRRLLGLYERAEYERYRFFDIANGGMALREHPLTGIDRMPIYIDRLLGDVKLSHKNVVARPKGRYSYTCKPEATGDTTVTGSIRWVTIPDAVPPQTGKIDDIPRKSRRPPIDITLDELISTADEVGEKTGKTHYDAVLRRVKDQGLLKRARGGSTSVADGLRLDEVVSLVGLVGAGKSVLANMLIVCLAKRGLRIAFAKTGRLTQFIEPEDSKDSPEIRARVAVRDLMRQLGFVPEPARNSRGIDTSIPAIGLKVYNSGNGKARASFPYCVRQDMRSGAVTVYCPLLPDGSLPYWRALIEFARLSGSEGFPDSCKRANGMALKRMLHGIVRATGDRPELLLINSYGRIRQRDWWPGISDSGLESGPLSYGPTGYEEPLGLAGSKLRILRIRSGLNGEIPDWFTDEVAAGGADDGTVPNRRDKQGLFKMDGYFLALAPRPGDAQYKWSARGSKYDSPTAAFCEKTINEYCLLSPGGEAEALASVKYAEALRGCMVQLYKNDMRVNLPAPLHLAEQVEEYIWDWELTGRR